VHGYKKLIVWQKSVELVVEIYRITEHFPKSEMYGLTNQMRRASVSVPSNIAEGYRRKGKNEFNRFLPISYGSGAELETQIEIAKALRFVELKEYLKADMILDEIMRMLNKMLETK